MSKIVITIDLNKKVRPSAEELREFEYENELDYWIEYAMSDPVEILDNAKWELKENEDND